MADGQIVGPRTFQNRNPASRSYGPGFVTVNNPNVPGQTQVVPELRDGGGSSGGSSGGGGGSSSSGGFPSTITTRQEVVIPDFLKPIIESQNRRTVIGNEALNRFRKEIDKGNLVAPLNEDQLRSLDMAREVATGSDLQTAINAARQTAAGDFLGEGQAGIGLLSQFAQGTPPGLDTSGEGFQNAFEAAVRRAQPGIFSTFAQAGRSGSGLAQTAQTQAQADAFAGLFNQARERQLRSALSLGNLFNAERGRQMNAAQILPGLALQPSQIFGNVGDVLQEQSQKERTAPIQARQAMAQIAAGSATPVNIGALTGTTTTQPVQPTALIQNLTAAGIDPQSEQGQQIIINALNPSSGSGSSGSAAGSALLGGLGGAGTGFAIGGPTGAAIGAGVGLLGGLL